MADQAVGPDAPHSTSLSTTRIEGAFDRITGLAARLLAAPIALVLLWEEGREVVGSAVGLPASRVDRLELPVPTAIRQSLCTGKEVVVDHVPQNPHHPAGFPVSGLAGAAYLAVPLTTRSGSTWGSLWAIDTQPRRWTPEQRETARELAALAMMEWELRSEVAESRQLAQDLQRAAGDVDVQERRRIAALHESHALLHALTEGTSDAIFAKDRTGRYLMINTAGARFLGKRVADVIGRHDMDLFTPETVQQVLESDRQVLETGEITTREEHATAAGVTRTYLATKGPLRNERGEIMGTFGISRDISDRKMAEEALRDSQEYLRTIIEAEPECVKVVAPDGIVLDMNAAGLEMVSADHREQVLGRSIFPLIAPEDREAFQAFHQRVCQGIPGTLEYQLVGLAGRRRRAESHAAPLVHRTYGTVHLAVTRDVTEKRATEQALRDSESRFRSICEAAPLGIFLVDVEGLDTYSNAERLRQLGLTAKEALGTGWTNALHPDDRDRVIAGRGEARRTASLFESTHRFVHSDGTVVWCEVRVLPLREGEQTLGYVGASLDITRRKETEEALTASEALLRAVFEGAAIGIALVDPDGRATQVNPTLERMLGYSAAELRGLTFSEVTHPDDRGEEQRVFHDLLAGTRGHSQVEMRYVRRDGQVVWGHLVASILRDEQGRARHLIYMVEDITDRRTAEAAIQRVQEQLTQAQKMEAIGRLAGGVAHDFNNMLAVINGYSELLLSRRDLDAAMRTSLTEVKKAGERAADLTGQLLAFSRKSLVTYQLLDLNESIRGMERMLHRLIGEDIDLITELEADAGSVKADRGQVEQILMNLSVNARDAMPQGGRLLIQTHHRTLDAEAVQAQVGIAAGDYVELVVSDTGSGMDAETLSHLWEPFYSTKGDLGTGLGLSTVYGIIQQSGGWVTVESVPGQGSTFHVFLPRAGRAQGDTEAAEAAGASHGSETILVVEDEELVRGLVRNVLQLSGYHVLEARQGEEALAVERQYQGTIHLLLTDVVMPGGLSGREVAERVCASRPELKVLFMSGYTDDAVIRHGVEHEGTAFLQKPFTPAALTQKLRELLR